MDSRSLISTKDISAQQANGFFELADECEKLPRNNDILKGMTLGIMFFQPSTRTRISFEAAMLRLDGKITGFQDIKSTRGADFYQESFEDIIKTLGGMVDGLVIRHYLNDAAILSEKLTNVPVINAGDGTNEHPTQVLSDVWVMRKILGSLSGKTIALVGELENRAFHSFIYLFGKMKIKKILFLPPPNKHVSNQMKKQLSDNNLVWEEREDIYEILSDSDLIEMVPSYLPNYNLAFDAPVNSAKTLPDKHILDAKKCKIVNRYIPIMHPGPRMLELDRSLDHLPNFYYFKQSQWSVYMRMAILRYIFKEVNIGNTKELDQKLVMN